MKGLLICLSLVLLAGPALAISRYNSLSISCQEAHRRIVNERAVILRYPSTRVRGMTLYDRYVINSSMCGNREIAQRSYIPTKDTPKCPVYSCKQWDPDDDLIFPFR
ncbi:hypothetical protein MRS76_03370 [Rhizobiaceae bacterium n13]|uniref:Uncharacterized protein n=1 Tax=Ferirhizobium litorale TaxID=2927786 RepID=A0AAE3U112_9HYPH|nr:hypothetical protein [Fererhizobium litorale]MDI7860985.1 hypothetical protein [Fererhizobium litorale]MDI7921132.1 hypothetical protein [Fererhizobium litorale]